MDLGESTNVAIPLCLPNNCRWNAATGEYEKTGERRSSLYVVDEALQKLRTVRGKLLFATASYDTIGKLPNFRNGCVASSRRGVDSASNSVFL